MNFYPGNTIPIRTDSTQWAAFYGVVVGFNYRDRRLLVRHRDNKSDKREYQVEFKSDDHGAWYQVAA